MIDSFAPVIGTTITSARLRAALEREQPPSLTDKTADTVNTEFTLIPVLFGTDRNVTHAADRNDHFGVDRDSLHLGVLTVSIPRRAHRPGNVERPG